MREVPFLTGAWTWVAFEEAGKTAPFQRRSGLVLLQSMRT